VPSNEALQRTRAGALACNDPLDWERMAVSRRLARLAHWVEELPAWARPPVYGALFLGALIGLHGGLIGIPLAVIIIILKSQHVARDLLGGAAIVESREERGRDGNCRRVPKDTWIDATDPVDARALLEQDLTLRALYELEADPVAHLARRNDIVADRGSRNQHE
jgi:hypothetical protein